MSIIDKIFGTHSERELKMIDPIIDKIESYRDTMSGYTDKELKNKTEEFKQRLKNETLDDILPEAYAVVREAAKRVLGMEHYRVQLIGGVILHQGRIAEMRTGEGKTLVATLPAYLNALTGKGVHVVTVNDYLAQRDAQQMGQVHRFLGLSVGVVLNNMSNAVKKAAYACDITYVTNNEIGFDYLRDNMVVNKDNMVLRGLCYTIIDEVDSVLIDEARTPLIISGKGEISSDLYEKCDILARKLTRGEDLEDLSKMDILMGVEQEETGDFIVNEKDKFVTLTAEGVKKVEKFFNIENLADIENINIQDNMILALRAHNLMHKDKDYVVKNDQILIVDEFTGRIMEGRRYSDGLHQAIEAKEHVQIKSENKTLATITFQNFFNKYEKKSGMTGTALTEEQEFRDIYGMDVISIPTNKPVIRDDQEDAVYKTKKEKLKAICDVIDKAHWLDQPILVGTITIEASEELSKMLTAKGIKHNVLNAKYHEQEAKIIAEAGRHGAVTIATNMAGRGTDIKLDDEAREAGGLMVIGTERHESRRIDNQLRGRSGRQGDPGVSKFYISLEDDLMRLFGSDRFMQIFDTLGIEEGEELEHPMLTNAIEKAQMRVETNNYGIRKNLLEYDQVNNEQREIIYAERKKVLDGMDMKNVVLKMIEDYVDDTIDICIGENRDDWDVKNLEQHMRAVLPDVKIDPKLKGKKIEKIKEKLRDHFIKAYAIKEREFDTADELRELERIILLKVIDKKWMEHIDDMDKLRQGIKLQAYGQRDPKVEYKLMGYDMFNEMTQSISEETIKTLFKAKPTPKTRIVIPQLVEVKDLVKLAAKPEQKEEALKKNPA